ncbi:response regulator transcription factor [Spirosoma sp. BT702]|uniref:Response regulator transcription factor n=1 Tax=Spirosoma profusum TaxID=2771354 RepID=A0A926Y146_9BACT|nr:LytTR family DNA-binding domain-containing protein [Spirosoma profusum]MBD2704663.1 response regulator transcription factor [Spirosoma profusum]
MKQIQTIIIDDDESDITHLVGFIKDTPQLKLQNTFINPLQALMNLNNVDLIFLDIKMKPISGLEILEALNQSAYSHIKVVMTTTGSEYGVYGWEHDAVADFLLKPYDYVRFMRSVHKVINSFNYVQQRPLKNYELVTIKVLEDGAYKEYPLSQLEIIYVEAKGSNVEIFTTKRLNPFRVHQSLISFQGKLSNELFVQVHRSFIANMKYIDGLQKSRKILTLSNRQEIPMGEMYADKAKECVMQYKKDHS